MPRTRACCVIAEQTAASAEKSVRLTRHPARRRDRAAHRPAPGRADPMPRRRPISRASAPPSRRTSMRLQLLVGAPIDAKSFAGLDRRGVRRRSRRSRRARFLRPAAPARRAPGRISAARRQCADRRGPRGLVPAHHADRLARLCQQRADQACSPAARSGGAPAPTQPTPSSRPARATPTSG